MSTRTQVFLFLLALVALVVLAVLPAVRHAQALQRAHDTGRSLPAHDHGRNP